MRNNGTSKAVEFSILLGYGLVGGFVGYIFLHPLFQLIQNLGDITSVGQFFLNTYAPAHLFEAYYFMAIGFLAGLTFGYLNFQNYKIKKLSVIDELTGLYNRRYYNQRLSEEVVKALRYKDPLTLLVIDIDHFKHYNDHNGHAAGDVLLQELAAQMRKYFRRTDIICRYGGEEFAVIVPETNKGDAKALAEKFRKKVQEHPFKYRTTQPKRKITISIGLADVPSHATTPKALFEKADEALYQAKLKGRNRVIVSASGIIETR